MFALTRRNRSLCAVAGAVLSGAALALAPLYARSAFEPALTAPLERSLFRSGAQDVGRNDVLPAIQDPFARLNPKPRRAELPPVPPLPILPANRGAAAGFSPFGLVTPTVRAIVSGEPSFALVDDGLSTRIVGRGDPLGTSRVATIRSDAIVLEDGRHLTLRASGP